MAEEAVVVKTPSEYKHPLSETAYFTNSTHYATISADPSYHPVISYARTHHLFQTAFSTHKTIPGLLAFSKSVSPTSDAEFALLVATGIDVTGHPTMLHGGVLAVLFDEALAMHTLGLHPQGGATLKLVVTYIKPTPSNTTLLFRSWLRKAEGRKVWVEAEVVTEEGLVTAKADGVFMAFRFKEAKI